MIKKIFLLGLLLVFALPLATGTGGITRMIPPPNSITATHIVDNALDSPSLYGRGFVPDTPTVWITFDDTYNDSNETHGRRLYDAIAEWKTDYDINVSLGIIVSNIGSEDRFTAAQLRATEAIGTEILSHSYANIGGDATYLGNRLSHFGDTDRYRAIVESKLCLTDTIGIKNVWGFDWPAGDWDDSAWMLVAEHYDYCTGGYDGQWNSYMKGDTLMAGGEADSSHKYPVAGDDLGGYTSVQRWMSGHVACWDSLRMEDGVPGVEHNQTIYDTGIIRPGAARSPYHIPAMCAHGPADNNGTLRSFTEAKYYVRFIQHNNAAGGLFFHKYSNCDFVDSLIDWLAVEQAAGNIRVKTPHWVYENYVCKPLRPGVNLNPYPHFATRRSHTRLFNYGDTQGMTTGSIPVGAAHHKYSSSGNLSSFMNGAQTRYDSTGADGFDGNAECLRLYWTVASRRLAFPVQVPPGATVYASCKFTNYGCFAETDSSEIGVLVVPYPNNPNYPMSSYSASGKAHDMYEIDDQLDSPYRPFDTTDDTGISPMSQTMWPSDLGGSLKAENFPMQITNIRSDVDWWTECRDSKRTDSGFAIVYILLGTENLGGQAWTAAGNPETWVKADEFVWGYTLPAGGMVPTR